MTSSSVPSPRGTPSPFPPSAGGLLGADFLRTVAAILLCQLPLWLMQTRLPVTRPVFNLDLFLALLIALWSRRWGMAALVTGWIVEICRDASSSYHFIDADDFVDAVRFIDFVRLDNILNWQLLLGVGTMSVCGLAIYRLLGSRPPAKVNLTVLALLAFGADTLNGSNRIIGLGADRFRISANIACSPAWNVVFVAVADFKAASQPMLRLPQSDLYDKASGDTDRESALALFATKGSGGSALPAASVCRFERECLRAARLQHEDV